MEIIQIVGIGIMTTILVLVLQEQKPLFAFLLATVVGIIIFISIAGKIAEVFQILQYLAAKAKVQNFFFETVLKIIGVAYIAEFGAQVTRDAGQTAIAAKIELAGKVMIMIMAVPIITVIIESVIQILPT